MLKYEAPRLIKYGKVEALTSSDMKCSPGGDASGFRIPWYTRHDQSTLGEEWDEFDPQTGLATGASVGAFEYANRVINGQCASLQLGPHPVTGK
jgi:hypothetical protein